MQTKIIKLISITLLTNFSVAAYASEVTTLNSFTAGTTAVAADVNENFTTLKNAVNDNDAKTVKLYSGKSSVSSIDFKDEGNPASWNCSWASSVASGSYGKYDTGAHINCDPIASVDFPDKVKITGITCYLYDNNSTGSVHASLIRLRLANGGGGLIYRTGVTTNSPSMAQELSDTTVVNFGANYEIVDNGAFDYYFKIEYSDASLADMGAYGCYATYE